MEAKIKKTDPWADGEPDTEFVKLNKERIESERGGTDAQKRVLWINTLNKKWSDSNEALMNAHHAISDTFNPCSRSNEITESYLAEFEKSVKLNLAVIRNQRACMETFEAYLEGGGKNYRNADCLPNPEMMVNPSDLQG